MIKKCLYFISTLGVCFSVFATTPSDDFFHSIEKSTKSKIGIYAVNTSNGELILQRENERFPMGCTSKVVGVGAVLYKSMSDKSLLAKKISYTKKDLVVWSPITEKHTHTGMTVAELCAAAIQYSDNTAMNLLVKELGGLQAMNDFARKLKNQSFRQDHGWPEEANSGGPENKFDTATPKDMANTLRKLLFTQILAAKQRALLLSWLKPNTTGNARIRAGVPKNWVVADKTGTSAYGTTNDLGVTWPPHCAPIILSIYYTSDHADAMKREYILAMATKNIIKQFAKNDLCLRKNIRK